MQREGRRGSLNRFLFFKFEINITTTAGYSDILFKLNLVNSSTFGTFLRERHLENVLACALWPFSCDMTRETTRG